MTTWSLSGLARTSVAGSVGISKFGAGSTAAVVKYTTGLLDGAIDGAGFGTVVETIPTLVNCLPDVVDDASAAAVLHCGLDMVDIARAGTIGLHTVLVASAGAYSGSLGTVVITALAVN